MTRRLLAGLVLALLLPAGAARAAVPEPDADPFYAAPPGLADAAPGTVLASRPVEITGLGVPLGLDAWQLLYRTTDTQGAPIATVATVLRPAGTPTGIVAMQPAEDALTTRCAPSYTLRTGTEKEIPTIMLTLQRGFAVVVPDFEGPGSHWSAGVIEGRATLDAIRAAGRFEPAGVGTRTPVGIWGYSGGGHASAWAAEIARDYAPELPIAAVAYGGVAADIGLTLHNLDGGPFAGILFGGMIGVGRAYPEMGLDALLNDEGRAMAADVGGKCLPDWIAPYAFKSIADYTDVPDPLNLPHVKRVIAAASLGRGVPVGAHYVYWAINDELNPISEGDELVARLCRQGVPVSYLRDPLSEHITLAVSGAAGALDFLAARLAGEPAPTTCGPERDEQPLVLERVRIRHGRAIVRLRNPNGGALRLTRVAVRAKTVRRRKLGLTVPPHAARTVRLRAPRTGAPVRVRAVARRADGVALRTSA